MIMVENAEGHINKGERSSAVAKLQEAVTLSPGFIEAHYQLGWLCDNRWTAPQKPNPLFAKYCS